MILHDLIRIRQTNLTIMYITNRTYQVLLSLLFLFLACSTESIAPKGFRGRILQLTKLQHLSTQQISANFELVDKKRIILDDVHVKYDVTLYKILYETLNAKGDLVKASGLMLIPESVNHAPLISVQHGATMSKKAVPSQLSLEYFYGLLYASEGYVTTMPDYVGLGDGEGLHPFIHADTEATATIDIMRSARKFCTENKITLNQDVFLVGYSQGGHATMATIKEIEANYKQEFNVKAAVASGGPLNVSDVQSSFMLQNKPYAFGALVPYILFSYNQVYGFFNHPNDIFSHPYSKVFTKHFTPQMTSSFNRVSRKLPASKIPREMFKTAFLQDFESNPSHPIRRAMQDNNVHDVKTDIPIKICHCASDEVITVENAKVAVKEMRKKGVDVEWIDPSPSSKHRVCSFYNMKYAHNWFAQLR